MSGLRNCRVYLDDIIVFSLNEHISDLRALIKRLKEANLKIQTDKTEFIKREIMTQVK